MAAAQAARWTPFGWCWSLSWDAQQGAWASLAVHLVASLAPRRRAGPVLGAPHRARPGESGHAFRRGRPDQGLATRRAAARRGGGRAHGRGAALPAPRLAAGHAAARTRRGAVHHARPGSDQGPDGAAPHRAVPVRRHDRDRLGLGPERRRLGAVDPGPGAGARRPRAGGARRGRRPPHRPAPGREPRRDARPVARPRRAGTARHDRRPVARRAGHRHLGGLDVAAVPAAAHGGPGPPQHRRQRRGPRRVVAVDGHARSSAPFPRSSCSPSRPWAPGGWAGRVWPSGCSSARSPAGAASGWPASAWRGPGPRSSSGSPSAPREPAPRPVGVPPRGWGRRASGSRPAASVGAPAARSGGPAEDV